MPREQTTQRNIIQYLESIGCYVVKVVTATKAGVPDILACLPDGRFLAIEVKAGKPEPTPLQHHNLEKIKSAAGIAFTANSIAMVKQYLKEAA